MHVYSVAEVTAFNEKGDKLGTFDVPWLINDIESRAGASLAIPFKEGEATLTGRVLLGLFESTNYMFRKKNQAKAICQQNLANKIKLVRQSKAREIGNENMFEAGKSRHTDILTFYEC